MKISSVREMLYESLRLLNNDRKYDIFRVLVNRKEVTSIDIEQDLRQKKGGESIGYIDDTLRELERVRLANRLLPDSPKTSQGQIAGKTKFKSKYSCYGITQYGELINRFLQAYESDNPWVDLQPSPEDILKLVEGMSSEEFKSLVEKFSAVYFFTSLLFGICAQEERAASTDALYHYLRGKLEPQQINALLKNYPTFIKIQAESMSRIDRIKAAIARAFHGKIFRPWFDPFKASYSLTGEGQRVLEKLLRQGITPKDLGMELEYVKRTYTKKELLRQIVSTSVGSLVAVAIGTITSWLGIDAIMKSNFAYGLLLTGFGILMFWATFSALRSFYSYFVRFKSKQKQAL